MFLAYLDLILKSEFRKNSSIVVLFVKNHAIIYRFVECFLKLVLTSPLNLAIIFTLLGPFDGSFVLYLSSLDSFL
jgi:hypothetical protein